MNETAKNRSSNLCDINSSMLESYHFYISITCSIASLFGNSLVILTVYMNKSLRSTPNYVIVNMAVSDMFTPAMNLLYNILIDQKRSGKLSTTQGSAICRFEYIFINFSFGVSMLSLVVITVHRLYAVTCPLRARLDSLRICIVLLLCTWIMPTILFGSMVPFITFESSSHSCVSLMSESQHLVHSIVNIAVFTGVPLLAMMILYPVIIITLRRQRVQGNATSSLIVRRRKQNIILTKMFLTIIFSLILTYLSHDVVHFILNYWHVTDAATQCTLFLIWAVVAPFPFIFPAVSPVIYFMFCSSYREGVKTLFYCCNHHYKNGRRVLQLREGCLIPLAYLPQRSSTRLSCKFQTSNS